MITTRSTFWLLQFVAIGLTACGMLAADDTRVTVLDRPDATLTNSHYTGNRPPLLPSPLIKLPIGTVRPEGWTYRLLRLQAEGFHGHLTEISQFVQKQNNAWLNPTGHGQRGWEEPPYWLK
jgi:hypothetical protein